ncbi:unnamed protein product [Amoebophrya sp. A120]|nr:unnamed protein product [Amoebophrya sp. A120]|eukprot:GSA120T00020019001.1
MEQEVKEDGMAGRWNFDHHLNKYGCFLFHDPAVGVLKPIVAHLHGRMFWSKDERVARGWPAVPLFSKYERLARLEGGIVPEETVCEDGLDDVERDRRRADPEKAVEEDEGYLWQELFD